MIVTLHRPGYEQLMKRYSLGYEDFEHLVRGGTLLVGDGVGDIEIALQDIGFFVMREIVDEADKDGVDRLREVREAGG